MVAHIVPALDCPVQGLYAHTYMHLWVKNLSISKSCLSFIHVLLVLYCCDTCASAMWLWACVCVLVLLLYCQNFCISYLAFCPACSISVCLYFPVNVRGECEGLCFTRPRAASYCVLGLDCQAQLIQILVLESSLMQARHLIRPGDLSVYSHRWLYLVRAIVWTLPWWVFTSELRATRNIPHPVFKDLL